LVAATGRAGLSVFIGGFFPGCSLWFIFSVCCRWLNGYEKLNYLHLNPVRAGLVEKAVDWRWSSARWYEQRRSVEVPIQWIEESEPELSTLNFLFATVSAE